MHTLDGPSTATQQHMYPSTFPIPVPKGLYHLKLSGPEKTISSSINICLILNFFRSIHILRWTPTGLPYIYKPTQTMTTKAIWEPVPHKWAIYIKEHTDSPGTPWEIRVILKLQRYLKDRIQQAYFNGLQEEHDHYIQDLSDIFHVILLGIDSILCRENFNPKVHLPTPGSNLLTLKYTCPLQAQICYQTHPFR